MHETLKAQVRSEMWNVLKVIVPCGRKAFMIISGGVNIYPQEAENRLIEHPDVMDVAVFDVLDERWAKQSKLWSSCEMGQRAKR